MANFIVVLLPLLASLSLTSAVVAPQSFNQSFFVTWAPSKVRFLGAGQELQLTLDRYSGSGFASKQSYLFGNINMQIKLVPGDSAGTVTAYYLASHSANRDELDFEFLGNVSGQPYILQTNIYSNGIGGREQRIYLWFDPTTDFHTYSVSWNKQRIIFLVDGVPIRVFSNNAGLGVPFPSMQPMGVFSSLWNADDWATQGGLIKINWDHAPFVASYRNFLTDACVVEGSTMSSISACSASSFASNQNAPAVPEGILHQKLDWVQKNYMIYDYCSDKLRYPTAPPDCVHVDF